MNRRDFSSFLVVLFLAIGCQETGGHEEKVETTLVKDQAPRSVETATVTSNPLPVPEFTPTPIPINTPVVISTPIAPRISEEEKFLQKIVIKFGTNDFYHLREQSFKDLVESNDFLVKQSFAKKYFDSFEFQVANYPDFPKESLHSNYYEKMKSDALAYFFQTLAFLIEKEKDITGQSSDEKMKNLYAFISALDESLLDDLNSQHINMFSLLRENIPNMQNVDKEFLIYALKVRFKYLAASVLEQVSDWENLSHSERSRMQYFYWTPDYLKNPSSYSTQIIAWNKVLQNASETRTFLAEMHETVDLDKKILKAFQNMRRKEGRPEQNLSEFYKNLDGLLPRNN